MLARCSYFELGLPVVEFLETQYFIAKSSRFSAKWKLSILLNFLLTFVSFIGVFQILKYKTLVLKTTWSTRASHFVDGWHLLTKGVKPASSPTPYVVDYVTREGGMGGMGDLVWARIFLKIITIIFIKIITIITILSYLGEQQPTADRIVDRTYVIN